MPASPDEDAPEMVNREQDDEPAQAQTVAASARQARPLEDSRKAPARGEGDDAQDLVDHMRQMEPVSYTHLDVYKRQIADGVAANTVRADMSAFFLVAAGGAAIGGLLRGWSRALLVPAALYGLSLIHI